jgi:hypothetical protein
MGARNLINMHIFYAFEKAMYRRSPTGGWYTSTLRYHGLQTHFVYRMEFPAGLLTVYKIARWGTKTSIRYRLNPFPQPTPKHLKG